MPMCIVFFLRSVVFEDSFNKIGVDRRDYIETHQNDFSFGSIKLLAQYGVIGWSMASSSAIAQAEL